MLLDREAAHAGQALAEHQIVVEPRQIVVEVGMPSILWRDVIAALVRRLGQDRFQRSHIAGGQVEGEVFLAREVRAGPRHWVGDAFGVDGCRHPVLLVCGRRFRLSMSVVAVALQSAKRLRTG